METQKSILITGASSGIGEACANHLAKLGFKIFAGILNEEELNSFQNENPDKIQPVIMDVTRNDNILDVIEKITEKNEPPLFGLVNNAGIPVTGVVEAIPVEDFRKLFEVNIIGMHAVTKAALPHLRKNKGRIVNMGSLSSFFVGPGSSTYAASKYAVRAYTKSLRIEVAPFGMHVSMIAPGAIETKIWGKSDAYVKKLREKIPAETLDAYKMFITAGEKMVEQIKPIPAAVVAEHVEHALTSKKPKLTYLVGKDARFGYRISNFPQRFLEKSVLKRITKIGS